MLEELTSKVAALVDGKNALGFNVKFDLGDDGKILVSGNDAPMAVSNDDGDADTFLLGNAEEFTIHTRHAHVECLESFRLTELVKTG